MAAGRKTGGRQKGSLNKATRKVKAEVSASGLEPLDYMLQVLRNPKEDPARRAWAAKEAAPYRHPKLSQVELGNKNGEALRVALASEDGSVL